MALYCQVIDLTLPTPYMIMVHFDMMDDAPEPDEVVLSDLTLGFQVFLRDANGDVIPETLNQKRQRMQDEYDAYVADLILRTEQVGTHFEDIRSQALGYRFPAAS